jgi:hypothetical protein
VYVSTCAVSVVTISRVAPEICQISEGGLSVASLLPYLKCLGIFKREPSHSPTASFHSLDPFSSQNETGLVLPFAKNAIKHHSLVTPVPAAVGQANRKMAQQIMQPDRLSRGFGAANRLAPAVAKAGLPGPSSGELFPS